MRRTPSYARRSENLRKRSKSVRKKSPELKAGRINRSGARSTLPKRAANTGERAKPLENPASKSSGASSQTSRSPRALASRDFRQWEHLLGGLRIALPPKPRR